jgi:hydrogenase maturation protease
MTRILVAGIGNIFKGDDAFGVEVAQRLRRRTLPSDVEVIDFGIRGIDLTYALLNGCSSAVLIDAAKRGGQPGTVYVIEPGQLRGDPAVIVEEGVLIDLLRKIALSMARTAQDAGVQIVTGDTKVVQRGACDKLFITTTGVGVIRKGIELGAHLAQPGDIVLVNGMLGDHGAAVLTARGDMALDAAIESDCAALHDLIEKLLVAAPGIRCLRDATRGGLATVLNEIADASQVAIEIKETRTPIREDVRGFCEILDLDPSIWPTKAKSS